MPQPEIFSQDVLKTTLRGNLQLDAIVCDPPYGIRHRSKSVQVQNSASFDIDKIHAAHGGIELPNAPEGYVRVHDENQHLWSRTKIGKMLPSGQFEVVAVSDELIEPNPFPKGYQ